MRKTAVVLLLWLSTLILLPTNSLAAGTSLQEKINQAADNSVILLPDGAYKGNLVISKPVTIKGSGSTVIRGDGTGNVIMIKAPGVRLENLQITHGSMSQSSREEYSAVKVLSSGNTLTHLTISDAFHGIYLHGANDNLVEQVQVTGVGGDVVAAQGNGIQLIHSSGNRLVNNTINGTRDGIYFIYSDNNEVQGNSISHTRYGLHYMYSDGNRFLKNHFSRNVGGAAIMESKNIELRGNVFSFHGGTRSFGLLIQSSDNDLIQDNQFYQNQRGIYLDQAQRNRITGNQFIHNHVGVELWASSSGQIFSKNRFFRNTIPVSAVGGKADNAWSENGLGNNWGDDLPVLDLNQDGIGDQPVMDQSSMNRLLEDHEPAYLFLDSPAVMLYEKVGQLLQQQDVMFIDEYPLVSHDRGFPAQAGLMLVIVAGAGWFFYRRRKSR